MEDPSENWLSHLEMDSGDSFNQCQTNSFLQIEDFRRDILQLSLPTISSKTESESHYLYPSSSIQNNSAAVSSLSFEEICFNGQSSDNAVPDISPKQDYPSLKHSCEELGRSSPHLSSKRALVNHDFEPRAKRQTKTRSSSEAQDHIMSERKRRQEMAEMFIALSTTIPGLKKINKASVLREAINHVKQLQERISVLEKETKEKETKKKSIKSLIIKKSHLCSASYEANSNDYYGSNGAHPEVEARGLEKEVLIRIRCEKRKGIMLKLLALLENIHLSITSGSTLQFGNSTLNITIIAQMGEEFNLTVNDLVKILEQDLFKLFDMQI